MNKPTKQEAEQDLENIEEELSAMYEIEKWCNFLSTREDVAANSYRLFGMKVMTDINNGKRTKDKIIEYLKLLNE